MSRTPDVLSVHSEACDSSWSEIEADAVSNKDDIHDDGVQSLGRTVSDVLSVASVHSLPSLASSFGIVRSTDCPDDDDAESYQLTPNTRRTPDGYVIIRQPSPVIVPGAIFTQINLPRAGGLRLNIKRKGKDGFTNMRPPRSQYTYCVRRVPDDNPWVALFAQMAVGSAPPKGKAANPKARAAYKTAFRAAMQQLRGEYALTLTEVKQKALVAPKIADGKEILDDTVSEIGTGSKLMTLAEAATYVQPSCIYKPPPTLTERIEAREMEQEQKSMFRHQDWIQPGSPMKVRCVAVEKVAPAGTGAVSWATAARRHCPVVAQKPRVLGSSRVTNISYGGDKLNIVDAGMFAIMKATYEGKFVQKHQPVYEGYEDEWEDDHSNAAEEVHSRENTPEEKTVLVMHNGMPSAVLDLPAQVPCSRRAH